MADNTLKITVKADIAKAKHDIDSLNSSIKALSDSAKGTSDDLGEASKKIKDASDDLGTASKNIKDASNDLDTASKKVKGTSDDLGTASKKVKDLGDNADKAGGALERLIEGLAPIGKVALGINEVAELLSRIGGMAGDLMAVADAYKQMAARLEIATGGGQALEKSLAAVREIANATGSDLEATAGLYARLAQSSRELGLSQDQVARLTETIGKAMAVSGASAAEAGGALRQLSQALASGVLRGDEFNSMMEQAPRLMEAMAQSLGVTTGELRKMAEQGKLTADKVVGALQSQAEAIDAQFGKMPMTVGRAVQQLRNEWTVFLGELDRSMGASELTAKAIGGLANNLDLVAGAAKTVGMAVAAGLVAQAIPAVKDLAVEMATAATKVGGLAGAIKAIPTTVKVAVAVIGLDLAIEGAKLLGESIAKLSPEVRESEEAMRRHREELSRQVGDARAAAQALDQYATVTIKSADAVSRMGEAERARYADSLIKAQQYWQAMAREASLMDELGQKGAVSAEEAGRHLATIRQSLNAVAAASSMTREAIANLIDPNAQALIERFGVTLKEMADKGAAGTEGLKKALEELRASLEVGGWFDAVQHLIEHGHRLPDILDYTLAQLRGFMAATTRSDAARDARLLSLLAIGTRGDARQLDKTFDRLTDHAHLDPHR